VIPGNHSQRKEGQGLGTKSYNPSYAGGKIGRPAPSKTHKTLSEK
jgi:hypothetical protein